MVLSSVGGASSLQHQLSGNCPPCLPLLSSHQSRTIQSWVENASFQPSLQFPLRTFCFKSVLLSYLLSEQFCNLLSCLYSVLYFAIRIIGVILFEHFRYASNNKATVYLSKSVNWKTYMFVCS